MVVKDELLRWHASTFGEASPLIRAAKGVVSSTEIGIGALIKRFRECSRDFDTLRLKFRTKSLAMHEVQAPENDTLTRWSPEEYRSYLQWKLTIQYWKDLPPIKFGLKGYRETGPLSGQYCECHSSGGIVQ